MQKERNSSVEWLRILSIVFIICSHFCVHGGFSSKGMDFSFNKLILQFGVLGNLGVDIFVMISGYFLSQSSFKLSRIVRVVLQVFFYSVVIYFAVCALGFAAFSISGMMKALFPIICSQYWFATVYVVLWMFSPFLNYTFSRFSKVQFRLFLGTMLIIWSVVPTVTTRLLGSNELCQFVMFYSIGAYVRKYPEGFGKKHRYAIVGISAGLMILSTLVLNLLAIRHPAFNKGTYFYERYSVLVVALSYGLLLAFVNRKQGNNRFVNAVSATTFGVYLIHDNIYMRKITWNHIFHVQDYKYSPYLVFYLFFCVVVIFAVCGMIDYIRQKLIEKPVMAAIDPALQKITDRAQAFLTKENQN